MIINKSGIIIRLAIADLRVIGRATQGVRLINLKDDDSIAAVAKVEIEDEEAELDGNLVPGDEIQGEITEIMPDSEGIVSPETDE
jgi:DNA gyrase subunit A